MGRKKKYIEMFGSFMESFNTSIFNVIVTVKHFICLMLWH